MKDMRIRLLFQGDANRLNATLRQSESRMKAFGSMARREFASLRGAVQSLQGKLAALGMSVGAVMLIKQSAELDKTLTRIGKTGDMSRINIMGLRKELFRMSQETGQSIEDLSKAFDTAVQAGLRFKEAIPVLDAVSKATAVTGAPQESLANSLTVAGSIFNFDLSKPGQALLLLDKMRVAGKKGRYEMEQLSSIFPVVGFTAKRAGMNFEQTLGFIEALSQAEPNVERGGTLAKSWLRLFTNQPYMLKAQKSTGVKFFDDKGSRRDAMTVFADIKKQHDKLKTDAEKHSFISSFLEGADTETITASVALLGKGYLENANVFTQEIQKAGGILNKELPDAINNAIDQTGRLKAALREAADAFVQPFNEGITKGIKKLMDKKEEGGLNMSGKEFILAGLTSLGLGYIGYKKGGPAIKNVLGKLGNKGQGIAEGKAIEYLTGVTPVFVVNMPGEGLFPGLPGGQGKPGGPGGGAGKYLPFAAPLAAMGPPAGVVAITAGNAIAAKFFLDDGGSPRSLGMALHGMPESDYTNDAWISQHLEMPEVKNDIKVAIAIDQVARVYAKSSDPNTKVSVDLNRGTWDNPLGVR
jgi:TP901 family phage tail tape measure protein